MRSDSKDAVVIPKSIAKSSVEINVKSKYKKLNHGKEALQNVVPVLKHYGMNDNELSVEVLKCLMGTSGS